MEDDPGIATQMVRGLTRAGYETGSVTTGQAALDWPVQPVLPVRAVRPRVPRSRTWRAHRWQPRCPSVLLFRPDFLSRPAPQFPRAPHCPWPFRLVLR